MDWLRRWIQVLATLASNAFWKFPATRMIYQGPLKSVCLPGLNCYSCPAATGACPIGALQHFMASVRPALQAARFHFGLYVIGFLGIIGSLAGRIPCGWVCPFGFFQELMYKIPSPKWALPRWMGAGKYVFLALFVLILPLAVVDEFGYGQTWFCKYICPAGTLEAGLPMLHLQPQLKTLVGLLFYGKLAILIGFLGWMVASRRPFCRTACPLGAIYSLFNRVSLFRMVHHPDLCVRCEACYRGCPMGIRFYEGPNQTDCIRCLKCLRQSCKFGAISWKIASGPVPGAEPDPKEVPG